ncbi:MAG: TRAP transporter large permease [bacterium]
MKKGFLSIMPMSVYFILIIILILINAPVAFALIVPSILYYYFTPGFSLNAAVSVLFNTPNSFPLLAVPLFILLGNIMNTAGISKRVFNFARVFVGHFAGGLAHANVLASVIFSGMSGAALADAAGLGIVEIKAMQEDGYDLDFSCAVTGASSVIGPIFPPSVPLVIYGVMAEVSIGRLLAGGLLPGLLIALTIIILIIFISRKRKFPKHKRATFKEFTMSFIDSMPANFTVVIILGGMLFGIVTPTECAILGVAYSLILGFLIYREIDLKTLLEGIKDSAYTVGSFMLVVAGAFLFSRIITLSGFSTRFAIHIVNLSMENPYIFLFILNILLLIIGCFMEGVAALVILVPIVLPIAEAFGISSVQLGVIMVLNLMIGLLTPPMGIGLYVLSKISKLPFKQIVRAMIPFYIPLIISLLLVTYVPFFVLYFPSIFFGS